MKSMCMAQIKESNNKEEKKKKFEYKKIQEVESTSEGKKSIEAPQEKRKNKTKKR